MKFTTLAASAASILAVSGAAFAGTPTPSPKPAAKPTPAPALVCPVTGEKIASVKAAAGSSTYKGKTYYFCCAGCKPMFDATPTKYVKEAAKTAPKKSPKATPAPAKA